MPGAPGTAFFDLYTDPREVSGKMLPFDPREFIKGLPGLEGADFDQDG